MFDKATGEPSSADDVIEMRIAIGLEGRPRRRVARRRYDVRLGQLGRDVERIDEDFIAAQSQHRECIYTPSPQRRIAKPMRTTFERGWRKCAHILATFAKKASPY
jgi:hypothetical protein